MCLHSNNILSIVLCLLLTTSCLAQDLIFNVQFFDQSDGLSARAIHSVHQDDRGLIWVGTSNGLNLFDGQKIRVIGEQNSRTATGGVFKIQKDRKGHFWIQKSGEPVFCFDPYKEEIVPAAYSEDLGFLTSYLSLKEEKLIHFVNEEGTMFYLNEENEITSLGNFKVNNSLRITPTSWNTFLVKELSKPPKTVEINKEGDTLRVFEPGYRVIFDQGAKFISHHLSDIWEGKYLNELFFELDEEGGLLPMDFKKDGRAFSFEDMGIDADIFLCLAKDHDDGYWLVARNKVWYFDENKNLVKDLTEELLNLSIQTWNANELFIDDHNRLWIASGRGLYLIEVKQNPFQLYLQESGKTSTRGIIATSDDELFVANYLGNKKINIHTKEVVQEYGVYGLGLCKGKDDVIWTGSHAPFLIGINEKEGTYFRRDLQRRGPGVLIPYFDWESEKIIYRD